MPRPHADESQSEYISRFMASDEAQKDYPDQKQRAAVAYSLWEHRNVLQNAGGSYGSPMRGKHLEAGLVRYDDLVRPDGATGATLLLPKDTIDRMRPTFAGKPIVNREHQKVNPNWFKEGKADGVVTGGYFSGDDAWEWAQFLVWDEETKKNCLSGYELSCAYMPTEIDWTPGLCHNVPYDGTILNGTYTHLAVVPNPRYEGAAIFANSKGGPMNAFKLFFKKAGAAASVELDKTTKLAVDGKDVSLEELVNAHKAAEAEAARVSAVEEVKNMTDESEIDVDGKKLTLGALKQEYRCALERKNAEDAEKKKKDDEEAERKNAEDKAKKDAEEKAEKEKQEAQNALDKKTAEDAAAQKIKDQEHFNALEKARNQVTPLPVSTGAHMSQDDKQKIGAERYGSKRPAEPAA